MLFFGLVSCGKSVNVENLEKYTEYVEGKGYCVAKYDEKGCNRCGLSYLDNNWSWVCTQKFCHEENSEKAHQCTDYSSKEDITKRVGIIK